MKSKKDKRELDLSPTPSYEDVLSTSSIPDSTPTTNETGGSNAAPAGAVTPITGTLSTPSPAPSLTRNQKVIKTIEDIDTTKTKKPKTSPKRKLERTHSKYNWFVGREPREKAVFVMLIINVLTLFGLIGALIYYAQLIYKENCQNYVF